jgi:D-alanine-D-alanine ligase
MAKVLIAYSPTRLGRDKAGSPLLETHILSTVHDVERALRERGHRTERAELGQDPRRFIEQVRGKRSEVVFNLCEHVGGDARLEKNAAALFELLRLPYTGNGCLALALCLEKATTKRLLRAARIHTPPFVVVHPGEADEAEFDLPAIVKPARTDGSLGITARSVVKSRRALRNRIRYVHRSYRQPALVERFVVGREFQVALLGTVDPEVLAVAELSYAGLPRHMPRIVSYAAKWKPHSAYYRHTNPVLPAPISERLSRVLAQTAMRAFRILGLRGYARVDFRMGRGGRPQVIDVNPNPDISADAGLARAAAHAGLSYADLTDRIVRLAVE